MAYLMYLHQMFRYLLTPPIDMCSTRRATDAFLTGNTIFICFFEQFQISTLRDNLTSDVPLLCCKYKAVSALVHLYTSEICTAFGFCSKASCKSLDDYWRSDGNG